MSTIKSIHHINYVVKNLEPSVEHYSKLLDQKPQYEDLSERGVKTARFEVGGTFIVLVQPLNEHSEVGQILKTRGEGLFLLSLGVDNLTESVQNLASKNISIDSKGQRQGLDQWQVCDLEQPAGLGPVLQICEN